MTAALATPECLEQLAEVASLYAELARVTGEGTPVESIAAEREGARKRLVNDWAARPRWMLAQTLRLCAARLWLALEREAPVDELVAQVEVQLPKARRVAGVMRPDALALCCAGELAKPATDPSARTTYVVALLVAGLERLTAPVAGSEAAE